MDTIYPEKEIASVFHACVSNVNREISWTIITEVSKRAVVIPLQKVILRQKVNRCEFGGSKNTSESSLRFTG